MLNYQRVVQKHLKHLKQLQFFIWSNTLICHHLRRWRRFTPNPRTGKNWVMTSLLRLGLHGLLGCITQQIGMNQPTSGFTPLAWGHEDRTNRVVVCENGENCIKQILKMMITHWICGFPICKTHWWITSWGDHDFPWIYRYAILREIQRSTGPLMFQKPCTWWLGIVAFNLNSFYGLSAQIPSGKLT